MKNNDKQIVKQAEEKIVELYDTVPHENLLYHNIGHTRKVVDRANEIAAHYELSERDITVLNIAAWFHDTGHLFTEPSAHEEKSIALMREWLEGKGDYTELGDEIEQAILATKLSTPPVGLVQEIIKDADTYHFGQPEFKKLDKLMKKEMGLRNLDIMVRDWQKNALTLLESHQFYTSYCKDLLEEGKQKNLARVKKKVEKLERENSSTTIFPEDKPGDKKKTN